MYIWELPDWPHFRWSADKLAQPLALAHLKQGRLLGRMERLGFALGTEAELQAVTEEAVKNAEIEGEFSTVPACARRSPAGWVFLTRRSVRRTGGRTALSR